MTSIKGAKKLVKKLLPPMRGIHPETLLSSRSTLKEPNNNSVHTNTTETLL